MSTRPLSWWRYPLRPKVVYGTSGEKPFMVYYCVDGTLEFFATGRVKAVVKAVPMVVSMPYTYAAGWLAPLVPTAAFKESIAVLRKITTPPPGAAPGPLGVTDQGEFPLILEYLTAEKYPTGEARQRSSLIVVVEGGAWKVGVLDKDNGRSLWRSGASLLDVMMATEEALAVDDPTQWRASGAKPGVKGKRS